MCRLSKSRHAGERPIADGIDAITTRNFSDQRHGQKWFRVLPRSINFEYWSQMIPHLRPRPGLFVYCLIHSTALLPVWRLLRAWAVGPTLALDLHALLRHATLSTYVDPPCIPWVLSAYQSRRLVEVQGYTVKLSHDSPQLQAQGCCAERTTAPNSGHGPFNVFPLASIRRIGVMSYGCSRVLGSTNLKIATSYNVQLSRAPFAPFPTFPSGSCTLLQLDWYSFYRQPESVFYCLATCDLRLVPPSFVPNYSCQPWHQLRRRQRQPSGLLRRYAALEQVML